VTNTDENRIEVYDLNGTLIDQFGQSGNDPGEFHRPYGIAIGQDGNVYVADNGNGRIQVFDKFGNLQTSRDDGGVLLTNAGEIYYMDVDAAGRLYAADYRHGKLLVIAPDGTVLTEIGEIDGLGSLALVSGVAVAPDGSVYLTNEDNWLAKVQIALPE